MTLAMPAVWSSLRARWESHEGRYYFDVAEADRACDFFPDLLTHHIGEFAGQRFVLMDWQRKLLTRPLFGWKHTRDGTRRFRKLFAFVPKANGKSPWASGTGLYLARCDHEPAAEVYAIANDRQQARTVHDNAKQMVEHCALLGDACEVLKNAIVWHDDHSTYQVLSSDARLAHGKRPHGLIFDELHGQRHRDLFEACTKSLLKRRQPMTIIITHAGVDDETICFEEYEYAKAVLNGHIEDEAVLPVIFEMQPGEDWTDPTVHRRVNPGYGVTIRPDMFQVACREAQNEPRKQNDFKRFNGNVWTNQAEAWIPIEWWDACDRPMLSDRELAIYPGAIGIDMAQKIDLVAVAAVFRLPLACFDATTALPDVDVIAEEPTGALVKRTHALNYGIAIVPAFWLPEETLRERVRIDHLPYDQYRDGGLLFVTEGAVIDATAVVRYIRDMTPRPDTARAPDLVTRFPLLKQAEIGYDPAFATELAVQLRDRCGFRDRTIEVLQNYKHLSEACFVLEALIKARRVIHGGHRLLRQHLEHVAVKRDDAGRIRPVKPKKTTKRIDGMVALLMAVSRIMRMAPPTRGPRAFAV